MKRINLVAMVNSYDGKRNPNGTHLISPLKKVKMKGKLALALGHNAKVAREETKAMEKILMHTDDWNAYLKETDKLKGQFSRKDPKGNPIVINGNFDISPDKQPLCDKALKELREDEKWKVIIEERDAKIKEYRDILEEDVPKDVMDRFRDLPGDLIPEEVEPEHWEPWLSFIKE